LAPLFLHTTISRHFQTVLIFIATPNIHFPDIPNLLIFNSFVNYPPPFMTPVNFGTRAAAFSIDILLITLSWVFLFLLLAGRFFTELSLGEPLVLAVFCTMYPLVFVTSLVFVHMTYCILLHAGLGQTIGKMIMGIKVVTLDNTPAPLGVAFLRWAGYFLSLLPLASGFLWAAVDKDGYAWHDRLSQTKVVPAEMT
jgi:uncharacterized RDD family membrane protein YckC